MSKSSYPPISDYGFIGDCHSAALISKSGSIDWCCMPRIDSGSCFARILGWEQGGYCQICPTKEYQTSRKYIDDTLVLKTIFRTEDGKVQLIDCFPMKKGGEHHPYRQILRIVEGLEGEMDLRFDVLPRFDYGAVKPWTRQRGENHYIALGGSYGLLISGDFCISMKHRHHLNGVCTVKQGQRVHLSILYRHPEDLDEDLVDPPEIGELDERLSDTIEWWRDWASQGKTVGLYAEQARRSAIVLKALSNAPTGAIAAAATTSLPEAPGGSRNWDYRFSWVRDSVFTVRSLTELGYFKEADGFRRFIERSAAGSADELQILFGVGGERRLQEIEIAELEGYRGAKPVRVGNAAETQIQLDVYGELLDLTWRWHNFGHSPDEDYWEFLTELVNAAAKLWSTPDRGIWEIRGEPRHFVQSKAMCWAALDRGIKLAEELDCEAPLDEWRKVRDEIRRTVEERGYDRKRGVFIQAFDYLIMDSALLLLPSIGFIDYDDERMIRTTDTICNDLMEGGLLRRYAADDDGLGGKEGAFLACSFWLAECLAQQRRLKDAHEVFKRALSTANDLGLYSEEYDTEAEEMLGNFPQGLTHLSLIAAAVAIAKAEEQ
ncbi:MAG: glycoside hydrolase family 15 protein [Desulfoferrobacter sp.]